MTKLHYQLSYLKAKADGFHRFAEDILALYRKAYPEDFK